MFDRSLDASMGTSPAIVRMSVDFPEPDAPISATISPAAMLSETFFRTFLPAWKDLLTSLTSIDAARTGVPREFAEAPVPSRCDSHRKEL
jgi:hypothetical protein